MKKMKNDKYEESFEGIKIWGWFLSKSDDCTLYYQFFLQWNQFQ